jgi:hypothetical protein
VTRRDWDTFTYQGFWQHGSPTAPCINRKQRPAASAALCKAAALTSLACAPARSLPAPHAWVELTRSYALDVLFVRSYALARPYRRRVRPGSRGAGPLPGAIPTRPCQTLRAICQSFGPHLSSKCNDCAPSASICVVSESWGSLGHDARSGGAASAGFGGALDSIPPYWACIE